MALQSRTVVILWALIVRRRIADAAQRGLYFLAFLHFAAIHQDGQLPSNVPEIRGVRKILLTTGQDRGDLQLPVVNASGCLRMTLVSAGEYAFLLFFHGFD